MGGTPLVASLMAALLPVVLAEEKAPPVDIGIAGTLIGAVSFQMGLFFLTNHKDPDMRKYTYMVINQTVSIFCAVLMFQTFNDIVEANVLEGASPIGKFAVNWLHMLFWFLMLQASLACVYGVIGREPESMEEVEKNAKSVGTLLAHMTGFASINAWGSLQQLEFFSSTPFLSFMVLPISFGGQFCLQRATDYLRWKVTMADGEESEFETKWDEETEEAENDIMGLTISFNLAQAIRFANSDFLPNQEGVEPMEVLAFHTNDQIKHLWMIAFMFSIFLGIMNFIQAPKDGNEEHHEHEDAGKKSFMDELKERSWDVTMLAWSMGFAWCCFFSAKMTLARFELLQDNMVLAMCLTLVISLVSFSLIRVLDIIADLDATGPRVDHTIFQIIRAIGLVVGFAWEQTFDQAVESLSSAIAYPHFAKFFLAIFCVLVIVPAWYTYILPMDIENHWEWGFLVQNLDDPKEQEKWNKVVDHIQEKRAKMHKKDSHNSQKHADPHVGKTFSSKLLDVKGAFKNGDEYQGAPYAKMEAGSEASVIEELRRQNQKLRETLEAQVSALKEKEQAEHHRAQDLQANRGPWTVVSPTSGRQA